MSPQRRNDYLAFAAGLLVPLLVAVAAIPLRDSIGNTNVALVLMGVVVAIAATGRRLAAVIAAVSAAVCFDFFATEPYYSFNIYRHEDWVSVALLVAAGLIVSEVAIWGRRQRSHAERTLSEVAALRAVAEMVARGEDTTIVQMTAAFWLRELLPVLDCRYEKAQGHMPSPVIAADGTVMVGDLQWAPAHQGLPGPEVALPVRHAGEVLGYFMIKPEPGEKVTEDRLFTATAIADQVGTACAPDYTSH